jgi:hypothetical protein
MGKRRIPSKTVLVGPDAVEVIRNLRRRYTIYLNIGGTTHKVLGLLVPAHVRVMRRAAAATGDFDWTIEVLTHNLKDGQKLRIHGVQPTTTLAAELAPAEVR